MKRQVFSSVVLLLAGLAFLNSFQPASSENVASKYLSSNPICQPLCAGICAVLPVPGLICSPICLQLCDSIPNDATGPEAKEAIDNSNDEICVGIPVASIDSPFCKITCKTACKLLPGPKPICEGVCNRICSSIGDEEEYFKEDEESGPEVVPVAVTCNDQSRYLDITATEEKCIRNLSGLKNNNEQRPGRYYLAYKTTSLSHEAHFNGAVPPGGVGTGFNGVHFTCRSSPNVQGHHVSATKAGSYITKWIDTCCYTDTIKKDMRFTAQKIKECITTQG